MGIPQKCGIYSKDNVYWKAQCSRHSKWKLSWICRSKTCNGQVMGRSRENWRQIKFNDLIPDHHSLKLYKTNCGLADFYLKNKTEFFLYCCCLILVYNIVNYSLNVFMTLGLISRSFRCLHFSSACICEDSSVHVFKLFGWLDVDFLLVVCTVTAK